MRCGAQTSGHRAEGEVSKLFLAADYADDAVHLAADSSRRSFPAEADCTRVFSSRATEQDAKAVTQAFAGLVGDEGRSEDIAHERNHELTGTHP
jgi:hypothetical protein